MKHIVKNKEPQSLKTYRSTPNASFNGCNKEDIRKSLIEEQGAICAYCMKRIRNKWNLKLQKPFTEIEHYKSQDIYNGIDGKPDLRLNYTNMLGVCNGNARNPKHKLHCDKSKDLEKNKPLLPLSIDPLNPNCEQLIEFRGNGKAVSKNPTIHSEINDVLNLNEENLVKNRTVAINTAIESINKKRGANKEWRRSDINAEIKAWKKRYKSGYRPYCRAVISYLEKRLSRS